MDFGQAALTHIRVMEDLERSRSWYRDGLGADLHDEHGDISAVFQFAGAGLLVVTGAPPTEDKPGLAFGPPSHRNRVERGAALTWRGVPDTAYH